MLPLSLRPAQWRPGLELPYLSPQAFAEISSLSLGPSHVMHVHTYIPDESHTPAPACSLYILYDPIQRS